MAAAPVVVAGTFLVDPPPVVTGVTPIDGFCRIDLQATFKFSGGLAGAFTAPFTILSLAPCGVPARELFEAHGTYVGTVAGSSGAFDFVFGGSIDTHSHASGDLVVVRGSGALAGLQGSVHLSGQAGVGGTYTGVVQMPT
jgi:hypothetical protein